MCSTDFLLEAINSLFACSVEPIQISHGTLNRVQIHLIVAVTQVIPESANRTPGNLRLMQFGERTELHRRFGNLEEAHPDGVIRHTLLREHVVEAAAAREVILDLRDVVSDVLVACCGFRAGHAQNAGMASRLSASFNSRRRAGSITMSTSRRKATASLFFNRST